jgi:hypothetical protein
MRKNESGQSTIEFIFTFAFGLSIILMIFNAAMNYTTGYIVHYATFMASRAYLVADTFQGSNTSGDPRGSITGLEQKAMSVFSAYNLGIFKINASNFSVNAVTMNGASEAMTVGTRTIFEQPIDIVGKVAGQNKLQLVSESFLGKEPTRLACALRVCYGITGTENCTPAMDITLYDDGC